MRKIAIMQPYLFPYLGYFHLLHAVDRFIVLDDVAWINRGWINRNNILTGTGVQRFSLPVRGASQNRLICELERGDNERWRSRFMRSLREGYASAPSYERTSALVEAVLRDPERRLAPWLVTTLRLTCAALGLRTEIQETAKTYANSHLHRDERILDICRQESADVYVNLTGGRALYSREAFQHRSVRLHFTESRFPPYPQRTADFVPGLSILDVLMWCDGEMLQSQLEAYALV